MGLHNRGAKEVIQLKKSINLGYLREFQTCSTFSSVCQATSFKINMGLVRG